ncbi:MAG: GyrI-like domain-containing protein, partial [Deltaproteobacteria bacterium]|nr:GyrI-like domain-containing protein [Deltaproteobacteria bacterium]
MRNRIKIILSAVFCLMIISQGLSADDTEIFGGAQISIPPNVLLIMDNSGSMDEYVDVIVDAYDPSTTYSGSYDISKVYYKWTWWWFSGWSDFEDIGSDGVVDASEIECEGARNELNTAGNWSGYIRDYGSHTCGGGYFLLRTGNYMNYRETTGATSRKKIDIAKDVLTELVDNTQYSSVRFGLMIFNSSEGGRIISPVGSSRASIKSEISSVTASSWTPLAETLAEAGLYFARQPSWCNPTSSSVKINYNTYDLNSDGSVNFDDWPVLYRCQKNYVILMTDGASTEDRGSVLTRSEYMLGDPIRDYDGDDHEPGYSDAISYSSNGSDYLDDVAGFLYDKDLLPASVYDSSGISFDNPDFNKQNIVTYTIGFAINHDLLQDAAANGGGKYFTTEATGGEGLSLEEIFSAIMGEILETNAEFVAPVVPVNRVNRTYADNAMYLGLFSPDSSGLWKGNLKKFGLKAAQDGQGGYYLMILDRYGNDATDGYGNIRENALSCWNPLVALANEGLSVNKGGAGETIKTATRSFKTYKTGTGMIAFNSTNITAADLDLSTDAQRDDLIN